MQRIDLTGERFGRLVVEEHPPGEFALCLCDCGTRKQVRTNALRRGATKSCGCLRHDNKAAATHGLTYSRAYKTWSGIKARCHTPSASGYENYGGRGITVCDRWRDSFENFLADMGEPPDGCSLERVGNDGPYSPENCRWATRKEQNRNSRHNRTVDGKCLSEWAEHYGVSISTIQKRLRTRGTVRRADEQET